MSVNNWISFFSPCIVAEDADLEVAARRIMWGKCLNSGQSCAAPDYILCAATIQDRLAECLKCAAIDFFGEVGSCKCTQPIIIYQ